MSISFTIAFGSAYTHFYVGKCMPRQAPSAAVGEDVADLIGPESADRFDVRPISEAEIASEMNA